MSARRPRLRPRRRRMLVRVYLYGAALVLLMWLALFGVGRYVVAPAVSANARPLARWVVPRIAASRGDLAKLRAELREAKETLNLDLSLYDPEGHLLATNVEPALPPLSGDELAQLQAQQVLTVGDTPIFAAAVMEGSELVAYGMVVRPPRNLALKSTSVAYLVVLVLLAFAAVPVARSIVRPLEQLAATTRAFGEGDLSVRVGLDRNDEIGDLARAFDEMAARVALLLRSEKEVLANVSHELRTPLARIHVALELAEGGDPERAQRYLREIAEDLGELERLVDDVLTAARLDVNMGRSGEALPPLHRAAMDGAALVAQAAARFAERHPERTLELEREDALPTIEADAVLLRRAIDNLLENAQKYSEAGSSIELRASAREGSLVVEVVDRGIGIDPADLPMVFKPFFRGDRSRARATGGVGLGLALARGIVEAHGGTIVLESQVGKGTCARVRLPVATDQPPDDEAEPARARNTSTHGRKTAATRSI
jgi:two-component system, OmpR family, sensor kinase